MSALFAFKVGYIVHTDLLEALNLSLNHRFNKINQQSQDHDGIIMTESPKMVCKPLSSRSWLVKQLCSYRDGLKYDSHVP